MFLFMYLYRHNVGNLWNPPRLAFVNQELYNQLNETHLHNSISLVLVPCGVREEGTG